MVRAQNMMAPEHCAGRVTCEVNQYAIVPGKHDMKADQHPFSACGAISGVEVLKFKQIDHTIVNACRFAVFTDCSCLARAFLFAGAPFVTCPRRHWLLLSDSFDFCRCRCRTWTPSTRAPTG